MWWLYAIVVLFLTAGFAKLTSIILNRILAQPMKKWLIGILELIQLALLLSYVVFVMIRFSNGHLQQVFEAPNSYLFELTCITLGAIGFLFLVWSTLVYQLYAPPKCQIENHSQLIDFRQSSTDQSWQQTLIGPRPMRRIALLPGNEQFQVEVSTSTYALPRVHPAWDGLSIVHLTDTHFRGAVTRKYFEAVCHHAAELKPDLFVFTGDLLDDDSLLKWLPETLGKLKAPLGQYFILGNHDWYRDVSAIRREFVSLGWVDLAGRSHEIVSSNAGPSIIISGDETPWMGSHPSLDPASKDLFQILLSHTPDNIPWARANGIDLMLAGHTHGGQIRLPVLGPVYSPSRFGCRFASGVFWLDPTLLYVSRGISGREPIRYLCTPELPKIILKSSTPQK